LVWVANSMSPQAIRDKIMEPDSVFRQKLLAYLEGNHQGQFCNGSYLEVSNRVKADPAAEDEMSGNPPYKVPTQTCPTRPPPECALPECNGDCEACEAMDSWWGKYEEDVDDLLLRYNMHTC
ncbi:hypothetical protein C8R46DRAFT_848429, partial [Mycena filopes]